MIHNIKYFLLIFIFSANFACAQKDSNAQFENISAEEVKEKLEKKEDIVLLDVRTEQEFNSSMGHIENAILIPVQNLAERVSELEKYKEKEIIVYCRSGNRSMAGTKILVENGFNAKNMLGGMISWNQLKKKD